MTVDEKLVQEIFLALLASGELKLSELDQMPKAEKVEVIREKVCRAIQLRNLVLTEVAPLVSASRGR